jgi:hypothetical protein
VLQAIPQAQLEALLRARFYPPCKRGDGRGLLETQKSERNLEKKSMVRPRGSGLGREGCGERPRGRRGTWPTNPKTRVEYWHELLSYIDAAFSKKFGRHYAWSNLARKNLWNLARVHSAWRVMALWDLYLHSESWWARQTGWSVYGMIRSLPHTLEDSHLKQFARKHEESLITRGRMKIAASRGLCGDS